MLPAPAAAVIAACFVGLSITPLCAAENKMGYQLLSAADATALPKGGGRLGLNVGRAQQINSGGLTFELLRVNSVAPGSPAAEAGFKVGDQVIAVDARVFPSVAAFASYVGSMPPSRALSIDYMPANGGPQQAQRVKVSLGDGHVRGRAGSQEGSEQPGLSRGEKMAIGVGAAALFGCYEMGCFSRKTNPNTVR